MSKIISIVGARPNFLKIDPDLPQLIITTGQHSDPEMSSNFFEELSLPKPLGLGIKTNKVGEMIDSLNHWLPMQEADLVIVYGDTNSSFAGAYAASQSRIPVAHIEAGLRSGNKLMKEENNRIPIDHLSTYRFCPTVNAMQQLQDEGLYNNNHLVGDVLYDRILMSKPHKVNKKNYLLLTLHRAETVDYPNKLTEIFAALEASGEKVILPIHPRTRNNIKEFNVTVPPNIEVIEPQSYLDMVRLEASAKMILTDSGGVQKEAYFLQVPCLTLRAETEWPETVSDGWNVLVGHNKEEILENLVTFKPDLKPTHSFGDGHAFEKIRKVLSEQGFI